MNRKDLQRLSSIRIKEARLLLKNGLYAGAYYLSGYAVECALKACIAKQTKRHDFPDRDIVLKSYVHNLQSLVDVAELRKSLNQEARRDKYFEVNWGVVKDWKVDSRYQTKTAAQAQDLFTAITDRRHGVLRWLKQNW